jgi:hypothetical protein
VCRFVGWITNFIRQRHQAAASCAYSYSKLTFVRRMPPLIRARLQERQNSHSMNTTMRGYIAPYSPHTGRGSDLLHVKPRNWRNSRTLTEGNRTHLQRYKLFTTTYNYAPNTLHNCVLTYIIAHVFVHSALLVHYWHNSALLCE